MVSFLLRIFLFLFVLLFALFLEGMNLLFFLKNAVLFICCLGFFGMIFLGFSWEEIKNGLKSAYCDLQSSVDLHLALYFWKCMIRNILLISLIPMFYFSILIGGSIDQPFDEICSLLAADTVSLAVAMILILVIAIPAIFQIKQEIAKGCSNFQIDPSVSSWKFNKLIGYTCFFIMMLLFGAVGGNVNILIQPIELLMILGGTWAIVSTTFRKKPEGKLNVLYRWQLNSSALWLTSLMGYLCGLLLTLGATDRLPSDIGGMIAVSLLSLYWGVIIACAVSIPREDRALRQIEDWPKIKTNEIAWYGLFLTGLSANLLSTAIFIFLHFRIIHN